MERETLKPQEILDIPPELRSPAQVRALAEAGGADDDARLEEALRAFRGAADPSPSAAFAARLSARLAEAPLGGARQAGGGAEPGPSLWRRLAGLLTQGWVWVPVAAAVALAVVPWRAPEEPTTRLRGEAPAVTLTVGLDAAIDHRGGLPERIEPGEGAPVPLSPGEALVFRLRHAGSGHLVLLEADPAGQLHVVFAGPVDGRESPLRLTGPDGREQAWAPDGPPGIWRYRAVLTASRPEVDPVELWDAPPSPTLARSDTLFIALGPAAEGADE